MKKTKVLVLGNDPQINDIEFSRLDPKIITLGVNRIWLKHTPNYYFFNDPEIIDELNEHPENLVDIKMNSISFSSDWLRTRCRKQRKNIPTWTRVHDRYSKYYFPDSITTAIELFSKNYIQKTEVTFYLAGVSLHWSEPSHFWKNLDHSSRNQEGPSWYLPRFEKIYDNFKRLSDRKYNIVSVHPDSKLNKLFRYENIGNLYSKNS